MTLVDEYAPDIGVAAACDALGVSRATWYRRRTASADAASPQDLEDDPGVAAPAAEPPRSHPRRLSEKERDEVVRVLCSEEFMDRSPRHVHAVLLERGRYLCSPRTMYRILAERKAVRERRAQRTHPENAVPRCRAAGPNQLWSWDITKIALPGKRWLHLYVVIDVYSRYAVTWLLAPRESGELAKRLIEQALIEAEVGEDQLTIHADRGSAMKSKPLAQLLADLNVERSHSRPRVSNDNPFSESQFKTMKYHADFPGRFATEEDAREWCRGFFEWYNHHHRHEGIGFFTPAAVHFGRHRKIGRVRQQALDAAFARNPERFVAGRPSSPVVPAVVWINRPEEMTVEIEAPQDPAPALPGGRGGSRGGRGAASPPSAAASATCPTQETCHAAEPADGVQDLELSFTRAPHSH